MAEILDGFVLNGTEYELRDNGARQQIAAQVTASTDENADYAAEVVDARVGAEGESYASLGEAIRGQRDKSKDEVNELKSDLSDLEEVIVLGGNISNLKWLNGTLGNLFTGKKPTINTEEQSLAIRKYSFYHSDYDFNLSVSSGYTVVLFKLDENGYIESYVMDYTNTTKRISAGYYAMVFKENSNADISSLNANEYANVTIETKIYELNAKIDELETKVNTYESTILEVGTGKQFTDLITAINFITDSSKEHKYEIHLFEGIYETVEESKIGTIDTVTGLIYKGLVIPDYVSIIGIGNRDNIVIQGTLPMPSDNKTKYALNSNTISTINLVANGTVENVTITAQNLRYCNHDDGISYSGNAEHTFKYVHFIVKEIDNDIWEASNKGVSCITVGISGQTSKSIIFERCTFENKCSGRWNLIIHDSSNGVTGCKLKVKNCEFVSVGRGNDVVLSTNRTDAMQSFADIIGTILSRPILVQSLDSVSINNWKIFATGNLNFSTEKSGGIREVDISDDIKSFGNCTN